MLPSIICTKSVLEELTSVESLCMVYNMGFWEFLSLQNRTCQIINPLCQIIKKILRKNIYPHFPAQYMHIKAFNLTFQLHKLSKIKIPYFILCYPHILHHINSFSEIGKVTLTSSYPHFFAHHSRAHISSYTCTYETGFLESVTLCSCPPDAN